MQKSSILAHRGLFSNPLEMNSRKALSHALEQGFGVETDLRDLNGKIVISHDPPREISLPTSLEWLLDHIASSPTNGRIGLNIKSDGLSSMLESEIQAAGVQGLRIFVFDMSVPDSISYLKGTIPLYSRVSDYEPIPAFANKAKGIWIDNISGAFAQVESAKHFISQGVRAAVVSPELHGRNHESLWDEILVSKLYLSPLFELCTDFPVEASNQFCKV